MTDQQTYIQGNDALQRIFDKANDLQDAMHNLGWARDAFMRDLDGANRDAAGFWQRIIMAEGPINNLIEEATRNLRAAEISITNASKYVP